MKRKILHCAQVMSPRDMDTAVVHNWGYVYIDWFLRLSRNVTTQMATASGPALLRRRICLYIFTKYKNIADII
jgi:hypothetical protein